MAISAGSIGVHTEMGDLQKVLIHCPDQGIGQVIPSKAQEWLYDDIVYLPRMKAEYAQFKKLLLAYVDPACFKEWVRQENRGVEPADLASPYSEYYLPSDKVLDAQDMLVRALSDNEVRTNIIASICAVEETSYDIQRYLSDPDHLSAHELARILITGIIQDNQIPGYTYGMLFAPVPNFVFTRDIGITVRDHIMLSRTASQARMRESVLTRYIAYHALMEKQYKQVIEITDMEHFFMLDQEQRERAKITLEGGDIMMISPNHLLVGCSERTTPSAAQGIVETLFQMNMGIEKVSVVKLPNTRAMMHLDTVMTQVSRNTWVLFEQLVKSGHDKPRTIIDALGFGNDNTDHKASVCQFTRHGNSFRTNPKIDCIQELLMDISCNDFSCSRHEVQFIYAGQGGRFFDEREQWTDACNVVAIKEGVVVGYERNEVTAEGFRKAGFTPVHVDELLQQLSSAVSNNPDTDIRELLEAIVPAQALLLIQSSELSRARGGPHCMTMPLQRADLATAGSHTRGEH